ncbi:hypothetical protein E6R18_16580 [Streptomyces sp. A1277]|nr:hypothetical protein E6R18_16580 [Streptomyces sp. A1277]
MRHALGLGDLPPDVLDLGNTQVASFAAAGGPMDLTGYAKDLRQGQKWLAGLEDPATPWAARAARAGGPRRRRVPRRWSGVRAPKAVTGRPRSRADSGRARSGVPR